MRTLAFALAIALCGCTSYTIPDPTPDVPAGVEAVSLQGESLTSPPLDADTKAAAESSLAEARAAWEANRGDAAALILFGRRSAAAGRYRDAAGIFELGAKLHPQDPRVFRHLGHRMITLRRFDAALAGMERAAALAPTIEDEPEPPVKPVPLGQPGPVLDTVKLNIEYHLGLAHYLRGEFAPAADAFRQCLGYADNADTLSMATYWLANSLGRAGRMDAAKPFLDAVVVDAPVLEYHAYHQLCLVHKGELDGDATWAAMAPDSVDYASFGYGLGNWHWLQGRKERALEIWKQCAQAKQWAAFGRIAAEVEVANAPNR